MMGRVFAFLGLFGLAPTQAAFAQEAEFVHDDRAAFETHLARLGVCAHFAIRRDPDQIDTVAPDALGEFEIAGDQGGDSDQSFARAFGRDINGNTSVMMRFRAWQDIGRPRREVLCEMTLSELSQHDALGIMESAAQGFKAQFPNLREERVMGRTTRFCVCTPLNRALQLLFRLAESGDIDMMEMTDLLIGPFAAGTTQC